MSDWRTCKIWSSARHQDELADWLSVANITPLHNLAIFTASLLSQSQCCHNPLLLQFHCYHWKLQRLQNRVLRTIGNFPRRTTVRDIHVAFQIPHVYDYITKLCMQQAEIIENHDNENVRNIWQGGARHRKYKRLKFGGGHVYDRSGV
jgi:hypothetical protein